MKTIALLIALAFVAIEGVSLAQCPGGRCPVRVKADPKGVLHVQVEAIIKHPQPRQARPEFPLRRRGFFRRWRRR